MSEITGDCRNKKKEGHKRRTSLRSEVWVKGRIPDEAGGIKQRLCFS